MADLDHHTRRELGCGWEPALAGAAPPTLKYEGEVTVCPGYSTKLPEVIEVARAFVHWEKGTLRDRLDGQAPTPALLDGLEVLQSAVHELDAYRMRPKGGA